ncbi:MAG: hypothetical protein KA807_12020 [Prolixibacteraceae bacterium]|nr:hypothetical protein [Prolixibacteraceae bacterium]
MKQSLIVLLVFTIIGCSKENDDGNKNTNEVKIDTIFPRNYFPAYPNSYWMYVTSKNDTIVHKTDSIYFLNTNYDPYKNPYDSSLYYAPRYDGKTVKGYLLELGTTDYHSSRWRLLIDDSLYTNKVFSSCYIWPNANWYGKVMNIDTTILLNSNQYDSVIVIMEYSSPPGYENQYIKYYYAKNIGIIKKEEWYLYDNITYEENLIDYKINN